MAYKCRNQFLVDEMPMGIIANDIDSGDGEGGWKVGKIVILVRPELARRFSRYQEPVAREFGLFPEKTAAKMAEVEQKKKRTFRKFTYRGVDLDQLLDMSYEQLMQLYSARQRRRLNRGLRRKQHSLLKRLRKAKKDAPPMEKPEVVKTHLRDMIILPEMVGSMVGVYNGKTFNQVEIKPEMIGHYLGEFSITYKPVKHGRPGIGATHSSRFIPLK
ncbi:40S ribosomal protein S15 [Protobothrops mucrosquamatus]|uniref:40S ribosomal protein S15 n=1 Tax=Protobothrops mucrosquamatus TaxID=103944 RepID=UPI0010FB112B|nr:40S ribosomal protein S15 [Protobothrops mucrosquamatus]